MSSQYVGEIDPRRAPYRTELAYDANPPPPVPQLQMGRGVGGTRSVPASGTGMTGGMDNEYAFVADPYSEDSQQRLSRAVDFLSLPFIDGKWRMDSALVQQRVDNSIAQRQAYEGGSYSTPAMQYDWRQCAEADCCSVVPSPECVSPGAHSEEENDSAPLCKPSVELPYCPVRDHIVSEGSFASGNLREAFRNPCIERFGGALRSVRCPDQIQERTAEQQIDLHGPGMTDETVSYADFACSPEPLTSIPRVTRKRGATQTRTASKRPSLASQLLHGIKNTVLGISYDVAHWRDIPADLLPQNNTQGRLEYVLYRDNRPIYLLAILIGALVLCCAGAASIGMRR